VLHSAKTHGVLLKHRGRAERGRAERIWWRDGVPLHVETGACLHGCRFRGLTSMKWYVEGSSGMCRLMTSACGRISSQGR
jgi:hypothetical protein